MYRHSDLLILREFKAELSARAYLQPRIQQLQDNITEIESRFEPHSPRLGGVRINSEEHDMRLAKYIVSKDRYERDLEMFLSLTNRVESILSLMPEDMRMYVTAVYSGSKTIRQVAYEANYNERAMEKKLDRTIIDAVKRYEKVQ